MERLLNLLQEFYGENRKFSNDDGLLTMTNGVENLSGAYAQTYIISKQGGFIKWLVDNDKIDRDKKEIEKSDYNITFTGALTKDKKSDLDIMVDTLLMLLAIQDEPIIFLCEIIK